MRRHLLTPRLPGRAHICMLAATLAGALLVACSGSGLGGGSGPASPSPGPERCGAIHQGASITQSDQGAEDCFWRAYQSCRSATLIYTFMGVDAGTTHTFTIGPGSYGRCAITDLAQSYVVPTNHNETRTYTCTGLKQENGGLLVSGCGGEGDVRIPPPSSP